MREHFEKGDIVELNKISSPHMMVLSKVGKVKEGHFSLEGIKCFWLDNNNFPHEYTFNFKDLKMVKKNEVF